MNKKLSIALFCLIISTQFSFAQVTVDQNQLSEALKDKMMDEITGQITSSIQKGEAWVANETYFSIVLEPFEPFGIDPADPNFINQATDIYQKIEEKIKQNPSLSRSSLLQNEVKGIVVQGLNNYASSFIDKESSEICSKCSDLFSAGTQKIKELLDATEGISNLDKNDGDYGSDVTAILKDYGIKSDYFYIIDDLDRIVSAGYEKIVEPAKAIMIIASAMESDDPTYKIEMLLELGEAFGGKIPIIGDLITPIFTLGKGVLSAAQGLEGVLSKNLNQNCISASGGTYMDKMATKFIQKFPDAGRVCPISDNYHPVYNNIFVNTGNSSELYFYINNKWEEGKKDKLHTGEPGIYSAIQWLRQNESTDKATDLDFIYSSYQKEYDWKMYTEEVQKRLNRIQLLYQSSYSTLAGCDKNEIEKFYMQKIGFSWLIRLLSFKNRYSYTWFELKYFANAIQDILNSMITNYYLSHHHDNLDNLDRIIRNLEGNVPINIYGGVYDGDGAPISGAKLYVGANSMFSSGDPDHKTISSNNGYYSYYILMSLNNNINATVSASTPNGNTIVEDIRLEPAIKINAYKVDLKLDYQEQDAGTSNIHNNTSSNNQGNTSSNNLGNTGNTFSNNQGAIDINEQIRNSDCAGDPNATALWDPVNQEVVCTCKDYYTWDEAQKKCVPDIQEILNNSDCSQYPNTQPVWDYSLNEPVCECLPGYVWNMDNTACVEGKAMQVANADCSGYLNTQPVWDDNLKEVICECLPGYVWNKQSTGCIPDWEDAIANADCSGYPNTEPVWDPVAQEVYCDCIPGYQWADDNLHCEKITSGQNQANDCSQYPNTQPVYDPSSNQYYCDCLPGYQWNKSRTGCVQEKKKPNIDWNNVLTTTLGIINAANSGNNPLAGLTSTGSGTGTQTQQAVVHQSNCNDQQEAGGDAPEVHNINLGQAYGSFIFDYETYSVKDQIIVTQGGHTLFNTGCVGANGSVQLNLNGSSSTITVRVNPNCDGTSGTSWNFTVHCPTN